MPFADGDKSGQALPLSLDAAYVEIFCEFIAVSVVLDHALTRATGCSAFPNWEFVDNVASQFEVGPDEDAGLDNIERMLEDWRQ